MGRSVHHGLMEAMRCARQLLHGPAQACTPTIVAGRRLASGIQPSMSTTCNMQAPATSGTEAPSLRCTPQRHYSSTVSETDAAAGNGKLDFHDPRQAFSHRTLAELLRHLAVLRACTYKPLVKNANTLLNAGRRVLGDNLVLGLVRHTFFKHFCAGENETDIRPTIEYLQAHGVGAILDFAAEDDVPSASTAQSTTAQPGVVEPPARSSSPLPSQDARLAAVARTYDYKCEEECDRHVDIFLNAIKTVSKLPGKNFAAIKVTALGNPLLLERISACLNALHSLFRRADVDGSGFIDRQEFQSLYLALFPSAPDDSVSRAFASVDVDQRGRVDYVQWCQNIQLRDMPALAQRIRKYGLLPASGSWQAELYSSLLSAEEVALLDAAVARVARLAHAAAGAGVQLMVDAEHTYFQPAIDHTVKELQRLYNRGGATVVFNTYQAYLKDCRARMEADLERARREKYTFAAKVVRGAYVVLERERALQGGYPSPICDTIRDTHESYNHCVEVLLREVAGGGAAVMVATHNTASVERAVRRMSDMGLAPSSSPVYFGQLLGMADALTFTLGRHGYRAFKYVPYGPVRLVMPYLLRRAQENSDVLAGAGLELRMLRAEIRRRLAGRLREASSVLRAGGPGRGGSEVL